MAEFTARWPESGVDFQAGLESIPSLPRGVVQFLGLEFVRHWRSRVEIRSASALPPISARTVLACGVDARPAQPSCEPDGGVLAKAFLLSPAES
jgi:hypothetical protein